MKFRQDILHLPLSLRLSCVPVSLIGIYLVQLQTRFFNVFYNDQYQYWFMVCTFVTTAITMAFLFLWDQISTPLRFMYSCFFKRIGDHGNDQQSRLESFYQDQAESKSPLFHSIYTYYACYNLTPV